MPYTNPSGEAVYINYFGIASGGFVVDDLSKTGHEEAYAQDLTLLGSKVTFSNCIVSSGGVLSIGSGATLSGATMYAGGSMELNSLGGARVTLTDFELSGGVLSGYSGVNIYNGTIYSGAKVLVSSKVGASTYGGGALSNVTIMSGGSLKGGNGMSLRALTVESGAYLSCGAAINIVGREHNIAQGAWAGHTAAYAEDGVLYDYSTARKMTSFTDITLCNLTVEYKTGLYSGTSVFGVTISPTDAQRLYVFSQTYLADCVVANANGLLVFYQGANTDIDKAVTLAGSKTSFAQGTVRLNNNTSSTIYTVDIYADNGVLYGLELQSQSDMLNRLKLADGISAQAPVINSGGSLHICSGATAVAPTVNADGVLYASGGATVQSANNVKSRPKPTFLPGWKTVPHWRTMMLPAVTVWPP